MTTIKTTEEFPLLRVKLVMGPTYTDKYPMLVTILREIEKSLSQVYSDATSVFVSSFKNQEIIKIVSLLYIYDSSGYYITTENLRVYVTDIFLKDHSTSLADFRDDTFRITSNLSKELGVHKEVVDKQVLFRERLATYPRDYVAITMSDGKVFYLNKFT